MKRLLIAAIIVLTQVGGAWAQSVPKKFQGTWVSIIDDDEKTPIKIGARTIDFSSGNKQTISNIEPGDEEGRTLVVTYKPTCSPTPCPNALPVTFVWKLIRLKGRETLMWVNQEAPALWMNIMQLAR